MITRRTIQFSFLLSLSAIAIILSFFIFKPYLNPLVLAGTSAIVFYPLFERILKGVGNHRRGVAAFFTVIITVLIVLIPVSLLGTQVVHEVNTLYGDINSNAQAERPILGDYEVSTNPTIARFQQRVQGIATQVATNVDQYIQRLVKLVVDNAGQYFQQIAEFILAGFLWVLAFYYFLRDGHRIRDLLIHFSPLSDRYDKEIMHRIVVSVNSVVGGTLIVALIQGVLAGTGFAIFDVPNPAVWGSFAVIAALIPTVGTALIMLPAALYLITVNQPLAAGGLILWSVLLVGGIDNIVRPKLIERQTNIHPLAVLLSVIGGIAFFGPMGFLTGPIVLSLLIELLNVYKEMAVEQQAG
jgi:predicted PurR-regulated permease PerM